MTRLRRTEVFVAGIVLLLTGCAPLPPSPTPVDDVGSATPSQILDAATTAQLEMGFAAALEASGMPGAAVSVRIGDEVWEDSAGVGDVETGVPFDPDAVVRIGSITKSFVGTVVLQLVDEGELALDQTLDAFIDGVTNGDRITVRDLLQMTSGVWEFTSDAELMGRWSADPLMPWTVEDTIEAIKGKPAQFEPGEKIVYTDSNYILLGRIVEQVTGASLPDEIRERLVEPLGLTDTSMPSADETGVPDPHQQGYRPVGDGPTGPDVELVAISDVNPEVAWAAGSMTSTLTDLARWSEALTDGELISDSLQAERLDTDFLDGSNMQYGLAVERFGDFVGHGGAIFGYNTTLMRIPERDVTVVIIGNGSSNGSGGTLDIFALLLQTLFPEQFE